MNLAKIKALQKKVKNKADKAIAKIYADHNEEMNQLMVDQIPKGCDMVNGNGMCIISKDGEVIRRGNAWSWSEPRDEQLQILSLLQYNNEHSGGFCINLNMDSNG